MNWLALCSPLLEEVEEFPCHQRAGVCLLKSAALAHDIFSRVWSLDAFVAWLRPPVLDGLYLLFEEGILGLSSFGCFGEELEGVAW